MDMDIIFGFHIVWCLGDYTGYVPHIIMMIHTLMSAMCVREVGVKLGYLSYSVHLNQVVNTVGQMSEPQRYRCDTVTYDTL